MHTIFLTSLLLLLTYCVLYNIRPPQQGIHVLQACA